MDPKFLKFSRTPGFVHLHKTLYEMFHKQVFDIDIPLDEEAQTDLVIKCLRDADANVSFRRRWITASLVEIVRLELAKEES